MSAMSRALIGAVDQGTGSSRFLIFSAQTGELVTYHQEFVQSHHPQEGWSDVDPMHLLQTVNRCITKAVQNLKMLGGNPNNIQAIGLTNQRETLVVWDRESGRPLYNAIIWLDARNADTANKLIAQTKNKNKYFFQEYRLFVRLNRCGLPITTYFSAVKLRWLLDNVPAVAQAHDKGTLMLGTVDTWLLYNFTNKEVYATDVTNASRTMLMNMHTLRWDRELCDFFGVDPLLLPDIRSSAEVYGHMATGDLQGVPISGILGDQQAALVGQGCLSPGQVKNTYGTGCFMLYNTGEKAVLSDHGLLTTVAYQLGPNAKPAYALEGSVAVAGAAVKWLLNDMKLVKSLEDMETMAASVTDTQGVYFVPAFSGLFCPYWRPDARGLIIGLSFSSRPAHIARALLEAIAFQTRELVDAMCKDSGISLNQIQVDGGMTSNRLLLQLQADLGGIPVLCPNMPETTALGAAVAAAIGVGLSPEDMTAQAMETFVPSIAPEERDERLRRWKRAVNRSVGWTLKEDTPAEMANAKPLQERLKSHMAFAAFFVGALAMVACSEINGRSRLVN